MLFCKPLVPQVSREDSPADRIGHVLGGDALKEVGEMAKHAWNRGVFKTRDFVASNLFDDGKRR